MDASSEITLLWEILFDLDLAHRVFREVEKRMIRLEATTPPPPPEPAPPALESLAAVERRHILATMKALGNRKLACQVLDIAPRTLRYKLKEYAEPTA